MLFALAYQRYNAEKKVMERMTIPVRPRGERVTSEVGTLKDMLAGCCLLLAAGCWLLG